MTLIKWFFRELKVGLSSLELNSIIRNVHFWIIIAIIGALTFLYYVGIDWFFWFWRSFIFEYSNHIIGILFIIPFAYASLVFWWRGALIVWLLSTAAMLPRVIYYSFSLTALVTNVTIASFPLMVVMVIAFEQRRRETQRRMLAEREKERQFYVSQIFKAQEVERQRIAQELHDGSIQQLIVIANRAQTLISGLNNNTAIEASSHAEWIKEETLQVSKDLRRLSLELRPSIIDDVGLIPALRWLAGRLDQESGVKTRLVAHGVKRRLSSENEVTVFRIVQEALNNVNRHSKAIKAVVTLEFAPESLKITVQDNGVGFSLNKAIGKLATEGKLGIIGMQQRAKSLNGIFNIHSQIGEGTQVAINIKC